MKTLFNVLKLSIVVLMVFASPVFAQQPEWKQLHGAPVANFRFDDIMFVSANTGWITNGDGRVYRTTDGGDTWDLQLKQNDVYFRSIGFADSLNGWVGNLGPDCFSPGAVDTTILFQTSNGGQSWSPVTNIPQPHPDGICGISVVNEDVMYATGTICGNPGLVKTLDGGETWESFMLDAYTTRTVDCYFYSADSGYVVGGIGNSMDDFKGIVLHTTDGGASWEVKITATNAPNWCWKISPATDDAIFISLETPQGSGVNTTYFFKTTDRGETWEEKVFLTGGSFYWQQGIGYINETTGWAGGSNTAYGTTDGGETWESVTLPGRNLNRFRKINDNLAYAVGFTVWKYSIEDASDVAQEQPDLFPGYRLAQNYPNPFNPTTEIEFEVPKATHVAIRLYNVLGQEVALLVDSVKPAGVHQVNFNAGDLPAGVYIYRIFTEEFVDTRKMLLTR